MRGLIDDANIPAASCRRPRAGPHLAAEPIGHGTSRPLAGQAGAPLGG